VAGSVEEAWAGVLLSQTAHVSLAEAALVLMTLAGSLLDTLFQAAQVAGSVDEAWTELLVLSHAAQVDGSVDEAWTELLLLSHAAQVAGSVDEASTGVLVALSQSAHWVVLAASARIGVGYPIDMVSYARFEHRDK